MGIDGQGKVEELAAGEEAPASSQRLPGPEEALSCLLEVTHELNVTGDLANGLEQVAERLKDYISYQSFGVLLLDDLGRELHFAHAVGFPNSVAKHWRFGMGQGIVGTAASSRKIVHVPDVSNDDRYINAAPETGSEIALPLVAGGRTIGVLDIGATEPGAFAKEDVRLLSFLADNLAVSIENARIVENMREQAQTLSLLNELTREFSSILDPKVLLERVADRIGRLIPYDVFWFMVWNEQTQLLEPALEVHRDGVGSSHSQSLELGRGISGTAAALRQAIRVPNVQLDPRYVDCERDVDVSSELAVPLIFKDRLLGVIDLESAEFNAFSTRHQQLLSTLASSLAIALENAHLYEKLQREEQKLDQDLAMARRVQRQLLPRVTPWVKGLQLAFGYEPARHLGGDFFDFLPYGEDRVAVAVGDVSGKATSAALYGALAVGILREYAVNRRRGPSRSLADLNRKLGRLQFDNRFLAMAYAVYKGPERRLRLANAGLPYPYLLRGGLPEKLELGGVPLGLLADRQYEEIELQLEPGDSVVLVSDGVEESQNSSEEEFGRQRLESTLEQLAAGSAREIAQGLLEATRLFSGSAESYDDRTIVVIKVAGEL
jgi:sigma-B regulation protein RsbU (phosphoserine phosphatase)